MDENLENALDLAATLIAESTYVVALTGAGLSVDSGIPTFRGEGGLWTRIGEPSMMGYQEFLADPAGYMRKQRDLESGPERSHFRAAIESAVPNAGHYALAELESDGSAAHDHHAERGRPAQRGGLQARHRDPRQPHQDEVYRVRGALGSATI